ncbi:MAG: PQQ-dependent sugar dehydrogenase [Anaerolineae bacterium]|nr:PQQ-dependent sugar dehydrogenase [Anaerolineae bacterium]
MSIIAAGIVAGLVIFNIVRSFILRPGSMAADFQLVEGASGFTRPLYVGHAGDGSGRLFVVEQDGLIRIIQNGQIADEPFLDVKALVNRDGSERGLLGLAFHPQFTENGYFFINYTALNGDSIVARYTIAADNPNRADPSSASIILTADDPYANHNAGQLAFGPDGYLYIGMGDGGSAGDPQGNGQNPRALLGKMLRVDINGDQPYTIPVDNPFVNDSRFAPEVWAWGLRNPWRYSFDRATGDLYIADVGQNAWEEINFQPAGIGGQNYGWNAFEGTHPFSQTFTPQNVTMPVAEYSHADGCSVTGGYVYRGAELPVLQGTYLFADYCSGTLWGSQQNTDGQWQTRVLLNTGRVVSSFGEDETGELYLVDYAGTILRFTKIDGNL